MKTIFTSIRSCTPVLLTTLLFCGCATSPTPRFYLLRPVEETGGKAQVDAPTILIRPVKIADYLDRPQIILRKSSREIAHAQFDRWAEPLDKQIDLYLTSSLAGSLKDFNVKYFLLNEDERPGYEVNVVILTLDGTPGGDVHLDAKWKIRAPGDKGKTLKNGHTQVTKTCPEPGVPGVVAATEQLLEELSREITDAFNKCEKK